MKLSEKDLKDRKGFARRRSKTEKAVDEVVDSKMEDKDE